MPDFSNFKDLEKYLNKQISETLNNEVKEATKRQLKENVIEEVYDKYTPSQYERTGGLYQDRNIEAVMKDDNTLTVRSIRKEDGKDIAEIIETGVGFDWEDSRIYKMQPYPRPFHEVTAQEMADGLAKKAMMDGLRKRGIKVE